MSEQDAWRESAPATVLERQIDGERIVRRAYEIHESRNRIDGYADDDWFRAATEYAARDTTRVSADSHGASRSLSERVRSARR